MFVIRRVRELYTVEMTVTFAGDLADLRLAWYSLNCKERDDRRLVGVMEHFK